MFTNVSLDRKRKICKVGGYHLIRRAIRQHLKVIGWYRVFRRFRKPDSIRGADHGEALFLPLLPEEKVQADVEYRCNTRQGGQGRDQFSILKLREHGRR